MPDQANNVTPYQAPTGYLSDSFDHTAIWEEQCSPLVEQLFAICKEHDIPLFIVALHMLEDKGHGADSTMARAVHFPGPHRVPHRFALAGKMFDDPEYAGFIERMTKMYALQHFAADDNPELET